MGVEIFTVWSGTDPGLECTTSSPSLNFSGCHPEDIVQNKEFFIANLAIVILIGAPANLVTLMALPYVRLRYPDKVPELKTSKAILILHLSLTDFLYCTIGLPFIVATLHYGYFPASASLCSFSSLVRNLIAYADFLTMAAIALTSSIGLILPQLHRRIAGTPTAIGACFVLWLLSFVIISPIVFGYDLLGYNFGRFGWNAGGGRCDVIHLESEERSFRGDGAYVYGMAIPCVVIFISYVALGLCHRTANNQNPPDKSCMHATMLRLSFAYAIFTAPLVPAHLFDNTSNNSLQMTPFKSMALYSWCSWMFAINVIIYVVSSSYFRQIYQIFFGDIFHGIRTLWRNCCNLNKDNTTPPQVGESPVIELT